MNHSHTVWDALWVPESRVPEYQVSDRVKAGNGKRATVTGLHIGMAVRNARRIFGQSGTVVCFRAAPFADD
jgi:hypothetical protein